MAKDPAMLWYWNDWYSGTILFSRFLKGCYIDLLHAQFNNGRLSLEEIKTCLGADFGPAWSALQKKFKQDDTGLFFNERLEHEKEKRVKYSESRKRNKEGTKKETHDVTYDKHMKPHMENENRNGNEFEIKKFRIEDCLTIALGDSRWQRANKTNELEVENFNRYLEKQSIYEMIPKDYKQYFAKLKGRYPDMLKRELTIDELRQIAREMDKQNQTA